MKRVLLAAVAASLFAAPSFAADTQSTTIGMSGTVAPTCVLGSATFADGGAAGTTSSTATPTTLVDGAVSLSLAASADDATIVANAFSYTFADSYCNYAHGITVASQNGGLATDGSVSVVGGTFVDVIGYDVDVDWSAADLVALSFASETTTSGAAATAGTGAGSSDQANAGGAFRGSLVLNVATQADAANPAVSGTYTDEITLTMAGAI